MERLMKLMRRLREPDGCPWDREQTFESMKACILEEAEEVCEAIDKQDWVHLREEIGDLLFNVVFIMNLAEEKGYFSMQEAVDRAVWKLIHRHPHVFGDEKATTPEEALTVFRKMKKQKEDHPS